MWPTGTTPSFSPLGASMEQPQIGTKYRSRRTRGRSTFIYSTSNTSEAPPPKKMRKKVQHDPERDVGKLKKLLDMPQDIFFEIASHLYPVDLLQLARVSRYLRGFLLHRSSRHIWIVSLRKISPPPPPCPKDFTEAKYVRLLVESNCFVCGAERAWQVDWTLRMRFCLSCWKANTITGTMLIRAYGIEQCLRPNIFNLLPNASTGNRTTSSATSNRNTELTLYEEVKQDQRDHFYRPEFVAVLGQCQRLGTNEPALQKFMEMRKKITLERLNFRVAIETWKRDTKESRKQAKQKLEEARRNAIAERQEAIRERLQQLGYEEEDYPVWDPDYDRIVKKTQPLTMQGWNQIRSKLTAILDYERANRWGRRRRQIERHYRDLLETNRDQDGLTSILPVVQNAMQLPCIKGLIAAKPNPWKGAPVDQAEVMALIPTLLNDADEERAKFRQHAVRLLRQESDPVDCDDSEIASAKSKGKRKATLDDLERDVLSTIEGDLLATADDETVLDLPSSLFACGAGNSAGIHCASCNDPMYFQALLEHWRDAHPECLLSIEDICVHPVRRNIPLVLAAFAVPNPATLQEFLTSGFPWCSCEQLTGALIPEDPEGWTSNLDALSKHMAHARSDTQTTHIMRIVPVAEAGQLTSHETKTTDTNQQPEDVEDSLYWPWQWVEEHGVWRWRSDNVADFSSATGQICSSGSTSGRSKKQLFA
ncbi:hypothetical protein C8Q79DRAFT_564466 [Trametes meyenii]|nr:hypothetical protein C8Q79DRAFT_564466 [Trametes meyenii]